MPTMITPGVITCKLHLGGNWSYFDKLLGVSNAQRSAAGAESPLSSAVAAA